MTKGHKPIGHGKFTETIITPQQRPARTPAHPGIHRVRADEDVKTATCYGTVHGAHTTDALFPKAASTACLSSVHFQSTELDAMLGELPPGAPD
jgi:hypothetical protein